MTSTIMILMAMRFSRASPTLNRLNLMSGTGRTPPSRYFSDSVGKGRILSEEERAAENVYIQKMEREKLEKKKQLELEKEKKAEEGTADKKAGEGNH